MKIEKTFRATLTEVDIRNIIIEHFRKKENLEIQPCDIEFSVQQTGMIDTEPFVIADIRHMDRGGIYYENSRF